MLPSREFFRCRILVIPLYHRVEDMRRFGILVLCVLFSKFPTSPKIRGEGETFKEEEGGLRAPPRALYFPRPLRGLRKSI